MDKARYRSKASAWGERLKPSRLSGWQALVVAGLAVVGAAGLLEAPSSGHTPSATGDQHRLGYSLSTGLGSAGSPPLPQASAPTSGSTMRAAAGEEALLPSAKASGEASPPQVPTKDALASSDQAQPRIEKTGSLTLVVAGNRINTDLSRLMSLATADGGFVESSGTQSASPGSPAQATATLQVPVNNFEALVGQVQALGKVSSLNTQADDVTSQYVDLQAQISALQDSRQQYLTIMAKATTVGQILAVQEQLDNVNNQLQQLQGQQQLMQSETSYSTLNVTLSQKTVPPPVRQPESGIDKAWHSAVSGFVDGVEGVITAAGPILFAGLLLSAIVLAIKWGWRLRRRPPSTTGLADA